MTENVLFDDKDFNFDEANVAGPKVTKKVTKKDLEKQISEQGKVTAKIIAEARKLAESKQGMDIDKFMQKHKLVGVDIEQLLNAPLKKDGTYA